MRGLIANERRNMLRVKVRMVSLVMPKCSATSSNAGAIIELPNGVTKEYSDTWMVA